MTNNILKMYNSFPIEIDHARGIYVYDKNQNAYIDTFSGIGVLSFGHSYPELITVLQEKMNRYMHLSNFFVDDDSVAVSKMLVDYAGASGRVFYTNSGTESTEAALKAIKKISIKNKNRIVYFKDGFHGRTLGALSVNGFKKYREPFEPLLPNTNELEFNNIQSLETYMKTHGSETIALFIEPVQGSGGVVPVTDEFTSKIMEFKKKYNFLIVSDEVQAGLGRTGKIYSYQHFGLAPDIITLGKSLGGGLPLGATIFLGESAEILKSGDHGSTFAPNPVALAGARYILSQLPQMMNTITRSGEYFKDKIRNFSDCAIKISDVRGIGLMIGIVLEHEMPELKDKMFAERNLLINVLANKLIRILPPFNIQYSEIDTICERLLKK
ncbi:MAG: aminotransferase class III-fold pyridoxal phosphate-dependent enzyme [Candidatus Wallbacteria bacterium]